MSNSAVRERHRESDEIRHDVAGDASRSPGNSSSDGVKTNKDGDATVPVRAGCLPVHIREEGESNRNWFHPWKFFRICLRSSSKVSAAVNVLWPFVPIALAFGYARKEDHLWVFVLNYIAMVPSANLLGFAGQELARKLPKVFGIVLETTLASCVELILMFVLLSRQQYPVIQAAILGSILANLLLCLGGCFFVGGMLRETQHFDPSVSEVGSGLLLVAGFGLLIPTTFYTAVKNAGVPADILEDSTIKISRAAAVVLLVAYIIFVYFQLRTHHSIINQLLETDEKRDRDKNKDAEKAKLTLTECAVALVISIALVSLHAILLVDQIHYIVEAKHVSDNFLGLILVPLVEKAAEHLTAVDEAWDNQMNFALSHILGSTIQTALLVAPLITIVAWGLDKPFHLNFEFFMIILLVLAILVVGNFLRDGESNYLEGALCVLVYVIVAVATWYYPNVEDYSTNGFRKHEGEGAESGGSSTELMSTAAHFVVASATEMAKRAYATMI